MKSEKIIVIGIVFALAMLAFVGCASAATIYVNPGESIQAAVDAANPGDTIIVRDGTYTENMDVNVNNLTIKSENGSASTIVQAENPNDHVFEVTADYVNISGFTVTGTTGQRKAGIYLRGSYTGHIEHCNISNNIVSYNNYGIYLECSSNNTIADNTASNNGHAIFLFFSPNNANNVLSNNIISNNTRGIEIHISSNNTLINNAMSDNSRNFGVFGGGPPEFIQNIDTSNMINGKPIYYLIDEEDMVIDSSWEVGYLGLVNCTNITVKDLTLNNNGEGVLLVHSTNSRIENVNMSNNYYGMFVLFSPNNTLIQNSLSNNNEGVYLFCSPNNILTDNFIDSNVYGVWLTCSPSILTNNKLLNNYRNLLVKGSKLSDYLCSIDTTNTINGSPVYYLIDEEGLVIESTWDVGYLGLVNCNNMVVRDLTLANNGQGLLLAYSNNSEIKNINAFNNRFGIYLDHSSANTLSDNILSNNSYSGIHLDHSSNNVLANNSASGCFPGIRLYSSSKNKIYLNNLINNTQNVYSSNSTNSWNSPEKIAYTYNGNTYTNYLGNYWDDYTGSDADGDGIGNNPYPIDSDNDSYPLMERFENYEIGPPTLPDKAAELAKDVISGDYLWGGKGYCFNTKKFVKPEQIKEDGYYYYDPVEKKIKSGKGLDCSGLIFWSYDRAYFGGKTLTWKEYEDRPLYYEGAHGQCIGNIEDNTGIKCEYRELNKEELRLGDLLFFDAWNRKTGAYGQDGTVDHVAMYVGPFSYEDNDYNVVEACGAPEIDVIIPTTIDGIIERITNLAGEKAFVRSGHVMNHKIAMKIVAHSPINLIITDPDGITLTEDIGEISGMAYMVYDINGDGKLDDIVAMPERKLGNYLITVVPEPDALPTDTYCLEVSAEDTTITLAEDVQISDIRDRPYMIRSTEGGIIQIIPAMIDFDPDVLNLQSKGKRVTTYIELPEGYDVSAINVSTVMLNDRVQAETDPTEIGDYDDDSIADLTVKFDSSAVQEIIEVGDEVEITVTGELTDGTPFEGSDTIRVID